MAEISLPSVPVSLPVLSSIIDALQWAIDTLELTDAYIANIDAHNWQALLDHTIDHRAKRLAQNALDDARKLRALKLLSEKLPIISDRNEPTPEPVRSTKQED